MKEGLKRGHKLQTIFNIFNRALSADSTKLLKLPINRILIHLLSHSNQNNLNLKYNFKKLTILPKDNVKNKSSPIKSLRCTFFAELWHFSMSIEYA